MGEVQALLNLQVGQRVKVKGNVDEQGNFNALEVKVKPGDVDAVMEGRLQGVDVESNTIRLLGRDITLGPDTVIRSADRRDLDLADLKVGEIVKLKGTYSPESGFEVEKVKVQEPKGYYVEELQGYITAMDAESDVIEVVGMTVKLSTRTEVEGY
ncbi:MAG: hypothetical protein D6715_11285 [Calditrichaeota bacterium]|nr:MAG: hypothetical protein D6715_11285 [Calditrichota bacterium]